jgi:anti-sigma factor RsiW
MSNANETLINCSQFEELLTDYLDKTLETAEHRTVAAHALSCPLCHSLLNEVRASLDVCREIAEPKVHVVSLEARILAKTMPNAAMKCSEFEDHLTDYLDGFLPAKVFHRWERHAVLCEECTDLPGAVVRSLAACVSYKLDELPLPEGLHQRILQQTIGTAKAASKRASVASQMAEWVRSLSFPISVPQLAPVAMLMLFAVLIFIQTVSADGSLAGIYSKSFELAEQTYHQGASALGAESSEGKTPTAVEPGDPITGTKYVDNAEQGGR